MGIATKVVVFDIETVPDVDVLPNLIDIESVDIDIAKKRDLLSDYHLDITNANNKFLRQPFQKVVAISCMVLELKSMQMTYNSKGSILSMQDHEYEFLRLNSIDSNDEKELISKFFSGWEQCFKDIQPIMVSFNGRTFDIPVLKYRAMKHGISVPFFYMSGDKWASYNNRYSLDWHCDLLELLSDFGASARIKMNEVCSILGFPGKYGLDGSKVTEEYDCGRIDGIRHYCETDVINTCLVFLRVMHHRGNLSVNGYNKVIADIVEYLSSTDKEYLKDFLKAWDDACNGEYYL